MPSQSHLSRPQIASDPSGLYASNPYRNQVYTKSPWQNFLSSLGFRTQADAWQENMSVQAAEYDAAIAQKLYNQEYDDPLSQVARMRAAGLNPDINGGQSIDAGSSSPMPEDPSTPMQSTGDEPQLMNIANSVLGAFSSALGIVNSVQGVVRNRLQNNLLSLQGETEFSDAAQKFAVSLLPSTADNVFDDDGNVVGDWYTQALESAKIFAGNFPKRMRKKFLNEITSFWNSAPTTKQAYETWRDRVKARREYSLEHQTFYDEADSVLSCITEPLAKLSEDVMSLRLKSEKAELGNKTEYAEGLDAGLMADAANAENANTLEYAQNFDAAGAASATNQINTSNRLNAEITSVIRRCMTDILDNLHKESQGSGLGASMAKIMVTILSMQQLGWFSGLGGVAKTGVDIAKLVY